MSKYYVKFTLEVRKVDDKDAIKSEGISWESADTVTANPVGYIKKSLKEQAVKLVEIETKLEDNPS